MVTWGQILLGRGREFKTLFLLLLLLLPVRVGQDRGGGWT